MSTLYESICNANLERILIENQTKAECLDLARKLIDGIAKELSAPQGTLQLVSPDDRPSIGATASAQDIMRPNGDLAWEFGFTLRVIHPANGMSLGQYWGTFTVRRTGRAFGLSWGKDTLELRYPELDHSLVVHLASELRDEMLNITTPGGGSGKMAIGFTAHESPGSSEG